MSSLALSWILILWSFPFASAVSGPQNQSDDIDALRQLHVRAVHELEKGTSKNVAVPETIQRQLEQATGVHAKGDGNGVSWADVLRETEFGLKKRGLRVMITVFSEPNTCAVHYSSFVGGISLDAGWTPAKFPADPKYYDIACTCGVNTLKVAIDATSNREVQFRCEVPKPKSKKQGED